MMCSLCRLVTLAGLLVSLQLAAAAVDVRLRNVETSAGPAYSWQVTSSVASQTQNITLYGNDTARTTFSVDIKRAPAGSGYTVSGRVVITNTPDANEAVYVTAVKMLMGPGLPWFGPTPRMLDCRSREIVPGDSVSCAFKLHLPNTATTSIKPSMDVRGQRLSVQGDTHPITFPAVSSASASDSDSSSCAIVKDRVVADGAEDGFTLSGDGAAAGLVGNGVQVCDGSASFTYTAEVGPFGGLEGICGAYQYKNAPSIEIEGFGSASISPAVGSLFIGGCRQKDMLGMLKPLITISKLTTAKLANASWTIATNSSMSDGSAPAMHYNSTAVVKSTVQINKTVSTSVNALVGEVTLTNNQLMPYIVAGVRLVVTRGTSDTNMNDGTEGAAAAQATEQLFVDANCPISTQEGTIIVPPQLMSTMPGTVRCTFDIPVDMAFETGTIQAQYKTVILNNYKDGVDSGPPTPYTFSGNSTDVESGACIDVWLKRVVNETEVSEADTQANPDLAAALSSVKDYMYRIVRTTRYVGGRMPPVRNSFLAMPYTVCSNTTIEWSEQYGPYSSDDCGTSMSIMTLTASDSKAKDRDLAKGVLATPLTISGCGLVPQVSIADVQMTAKKLFKWSVEKLTTPSELSLTYDMQGLVKYDVLYTRNSQITGFKLQGLVGLTNPHAVPITVTKVLYSVSRPNGQEPISGTAVCNETFTGASHAALDVAAVTAVQGGTISNMRSPAGLILGLKNAVTSFTLPPSPAALAAASASSSSSSSSSSGGGGGGNSAGGEGKMLSSMRMFNTQMHLDTSSSRSSSDELTEEQQDMQMVMGAAAAGPTPFYCSFVVPTPDDYAANVSVRVMTNKGEEVEAQTPSPVDWTKATLYETSRCAQVSSTFQQTQPQAGATLLQPSSITGSMPPTPDQAVRVCDPVTYTFKALFGPFTENQCGVQQAIISAAVAVPGLQPEASDNSATIINVSGCPDALPILTLAPATATQITAGYEWTIERSMRPLGAAASAPVATAAGPGPGLNTPPVAGLTVSAASGSVALFNQTIILRRSQAIPFTGSNQKFQVKGNLNIVNPGDNPVTLTNVEVKMVQPGVKKPVTTRVYCPMSFYKQAASGKGLVLAVPPATQLGGHPLSCTYGAMLSSQAPVELTATAITAPDGRWATSTNSISVALKDVQPLTAGGCVKVSEQQSVHNIVSNQTLQEPGLVGNRVPRSPEQLCYTKTYQTIGQLGPLKSVPSGSRPAASKLPPGVPACGAVKYSSIVSAEPTTGYQGKLLSAGELTVNIVGCHLTS